MKNKTKVIIALVVIVALVVLCTVLLFIAPKSKTNLGQINNEEDLAALIDKIYEGQTIQMPSVMTQPVDISDEYALEAITGLDNADDVEFAAVSEPMISSQAYSLVLVKVKPGVDANLVAKKMNENINERKWICVSAEKVYTTSSGDIVCLVMSSEKLAKPIYEKFKKLAGSIGEEFERSEEEVELPPEMY